MPADGQPCQSPQLPSAWRFTCCWLRLRNSARLPHHRSAEADAPGCIRPALRLFHRFPPAGRFHRHGLLASWYWEGDERKKTKSCVCLIRAATGEVEREFMHGGIVPRVAFDPAGDFIAFGTNDQTTKLRLFRIPEAGSTGVSSLPSRLEYACDKAGKHDCPVFSFHPTMNVIACVNIDKHTQKAPYKLRFLTMPESSEASNNDNNNGTNRSSETPQGKKREGPAGGPSAEKAPKRFSGEKAA